MDLSKLDIEALSSPFKESKHKNTDLEVLKAAIRAQLEKLIRLNKARADFAEKFQQSRKERLHASSGRSCDGMKRVSVDTGAGEPRRILVQRRMESARIIVTSIRKMPQTTASS